MKYLGQNMIILKNTNYTCIAIELINILEKGDVVTKQAFNDESNPNSLKSAMSWYFPWREASSGVGVWHGRVCNAS